MPQLVTSAINIMQDSLGEPLTIEEIASCLAVTARHLERVEGNISLPSLWAKD